MFGKQTSGPAVSLLLLLRHLGGAGRAGACAAAEAAGRKSDDREREREAEQVKTGCVAVTRIEPNWRQENVVRVWIFDYVATLLSFEYEFLFRSRLRTNMWEK